MSAPHRFPRRALSAGTAAACLALGLLAGCDRTVTPTESLPPLDAAAIDQNAGTWRMIVLTTADQVPVAAPTATTSAAYLAELAAMKTSQKQMTDAQRANVRFWAGGGVLRWNQVARELVARYNLPPVPRPDGTYPLPDAENPFADPNFPFANPPYAARAYSYVAVAQYEALKAAWLFKYRYNRPSPARIDTGVHALVPVSDLPSYPSEDAALAGVTSEMLKLLFPASVEEITRQAAAQREAALLSGRATPSDVAAGLALGRSVAALVVARARADGMGAAAGSPAMWKAYVDSTEAHGEIAWQSQDTPARPPMLMNFGAVRTWTVDAAGLAALDPPAPPPTHSEGMREDVSTVYRTLDRLTRDQLAIAQKWNDGAGTYTPPGHWNDIAAEYVRDARMSEVRAARTFATLNMAMHDAAVGCWRIKFKYFNPRPTQMDRRIVTKIGLPNFPAYPSGHSTFSAAAAAVLGSYFPEGQTQFAMMADEAGVSRLYGGIHYPADIREGKAHGKRVGTAAVSFLAADVLR